jgi:pimeloyl-ACP methyl ester carboxylesterase
MYQYNIQGDQSIRQIDHLTGVDVTWLCYYEYKIAGKRIMKPQYQLAAKRLTFYAIIFVFMQMLLSGCFLDLVKRQSAIIDSTGKISGAVKLVNGDGQSIVVMLMALEAGEHSFVQRNFVRTGRDGRFTFHTQPGHYYILAYLDVNKDGVYQDHEFASYYGKPDVITVKSRQTVKLGAMMIDGRLPVDVDAAKIKDGTYLAIKNIGRVVSLDGPLFSDENEKTGMWMPVKYLRDVGGGLFQLQEYSDDKIPVIFIHGINGGANDWKQVLKALDREHYQPWVLQYPSGLRLDMVSDYLVRAVYDLKLKLGFNRVYIVAHSMGGLVARSFVMKYRQRYPLSARNIGLMMTINTPMAGFKRAEMGVRHSPVVVPSWRDVAKGSDFIKKLQAWTWPDDIPYYLVFSFQNVGYGDGVVSLESQLPMQNQLEASKIFAINNSHAGVLGDAVFIERLRQIMGEHSSMNETQLTRH